jgi:hypothetical protein
MPVIDNEEGLERALKLGQPRIEANDSGGSPIKPAKPGQIQSNWIKPNQTQIKPVRWKYLWHMELHGREMGFGGVLGIRLGL